MSGIAVIYTRVSTAKQDEDGTSLETQLQGCLDFCREQGLTVLERFQDVHSGADMERPGLEQALAAVRSQKAGVLVAWALDRLSRNTDHQGSILTQLELAGARLELVTEKLDDTLQGKVLRMAAGIAAMVERERLIERTVRGRRARATLKGAPLAGGVPLYGYEWADAGKTRLQVHPETGPIAQRVYRELVEGRSLLKIAKGLTADGVPTPSQAYAAQGGKRIMSSGWNRVSILNIARNPAYKGEAATYQAKYQKGKRLDPATGLMRTYKKRMDGDAVKLPDGTVPALVSADQWAQVQQRLELNKTELSGNVSEAGRNLLLRSGFIFCAHCGRAMHVGKHRNGTPRYVCGSHGANASVTCDGGSPATLAAEPMESEVWDRVVRTLNTDAMSKALLNRERGDVEALEALGARTKSYDVNLETLTRQYQNKRRQQGNAIDDREYNELQQEIDQLAERIRSTRAARDEVTGRIESMRGRDVSAKAILEAAILQRPISVRALPDSIDPAVNRRMQDELEYLEAERAVVVAERVNALPIEDKRAILRWLGIRVEVYRKGASGPSGQRWEVYFAGSGTELLSSF